MFLGILNTPTIYQWVSNTWQVFYGVFNWVMNQHLLTNFYFYKGCQHFHITPSYIDFKYFNRSLSYVKISYTYPKNLIFLLKRSILDVFDEVLNMFFQQNFLKKRKRKSLLKKGQSRFILAFNLINYVKQRQPFADVLGNINFIKAFFINMIGLNNFKSYL